jgi:type IX secretion system PorP/SprF family membrane protein
MKKIYALLILLFTMSQMSFSQNDMLFSNYMFSEITYNPAMAGNSKNLEATLLARDQWVGFSQHPSTELFSMHSYVDKLSGGVGLSFVNDKLGSESSMNLKLMYAYQIRLSDNSRLSFGLGFGLVDKSLQGSQLIYNDMTDQNAVTTDQTKTKPDFDLGIAFNSNKFSAGISSSHIDQSMNSATVLETPRHYYLYAKYKIKAGENVNIIPSIQVRSTGYINQFDLSTLVFCSNKFWVGASYRLKDAVIGLVGFDISKNIRLGYSYDYGVGAIKTYSSGSHEIVLMASFDVLKKVIPTKTPRFFD